MPSIKKVTLKNGEARYRFKTDVGRDPDTGRRMQTELTFPTQREAKAELARIQHERARGTLVLPSRRTVADLCDAYVESATRGVEAGTKANYRDALLPVRTRLGSVALQRLVEADVESLVDWMLTSGRRRGGTPGTGLSARAARLTLGRLRAALNMAVRRQWVVRNVALDVTVSREVVERANVKPRQRPAPWTVDEVKAFLAAVRTDRLHAAVLLLLMGLRPAETCGLRWEPDVDLDGRTIAAGSNTRTLVDGAVLEKGAKTPAGERGLPAPAVLVRALKAAKAGQAAEKLAAGDAYEDSGYVVVDELGRPVRTDWLRRRVYRLMGQAGVRRVRPYDARHACLTYLTTAGVPDVVVSAWAGHADLSFTKRVYVHPDASHLQAAADKLDEILGATESRS